MTNLIVNRWMLITSMSWMLISVANASPIGTSQLQRLVDEATRGQPEDVAQCMHAAIHYVWNGSNYEEIRWYKDSEGVIQNKSYAQNGKKITEITIKAEGHVRDWKITDTYIPVTVKCREIDGQSYKVEIEPTVTTGQPAE